MSKRIAQLLTLTPDDQIISVEGWVRTKRESKNVSFFEINDGSSLASLQVVIDLATFANQEVLNKVTTGASVTVLGKLVASQEIRQLNY